MLKQNVEIPICKIGFYLDSDRYSVVFLAFLLTNAVQKISNALLEGSLSKVVPDIKFIII